MLFRTGPLGEDKKLERGYLWQCSFWQGMSGRRSSPCPAQTSDDVALLKWCNLSSKGVLFSKGIFYAHHF